ncbi:FtsX-like permease family protein, partial [Candidatus Micrarchaeota archaeon]|nr:FtsX-like permease family protein [Candidatus Micrarchaeota archaeon]
DVIGQFQGVYVMEKDALDQTLSKVDASYESKLKSVQGVKYVMPEIWIVPSSLEGGSVSNMMSTAIYGLDVRKYILMGGNPWVGEIEQGAFLRPGDTGYVVLGNQIADEYSKFPGSTFKIDGKKFKVKGIYRAGSDLLGSMVVMSIEDARDLSGFPDDKVNDFYMSLTDPSMDKRVTQEINFRFRDDLEAYTSSDFSDQMGDVLGNFRLLVFFIAGISAIVGGIGIINTILMSIMERTKEIGALKAVGWTNLDIMRMILYESMFLGMLGGVFGLVLGFLADVFLEQAFGLSYAITMPLVFQAFGFAFLIGLIAGVYPAIRASRLDPVHAIRGGR